jgi:DNA-directed RNA polymerase subunit alpha
MRVGNRTDFNKLKLHIETDGTITPHDALEKSIQIMIAQLKAIVGFEEEVVEEPAAAEVKKSESEAASEKKADIDPEFLKTRTDSIGLSARVAAALSAANIRTLGGLIRKKEEDLLDIDGLGSKGVQEVKKILAGFGISLK